MMNSFCYICVLSVLIREVCLQETVTAVIGGSVLLPCSSTEHDLKPQDFNVYWRHNGSELVYDIVKGEDSLEKQDPLYKNRTERLADEYEKGNYSIKLNNLNYTDAGEYTCYITHSFEPQTVLLIIKESTADKGNKLIDKANQRVISSHLLWVTIVSVVFIIL